MSERSVLNLAIAEVERALDKDQEILIFVNGVRVFHSALGAKATYTRALEQESP